MATHQSDGDSLDWPKVRSSQQEISARATFKQGVAVADKLHLRRGSTSAVKGQECSAICPVASNICGVNLDCIVHTPLQKNNTTSLDIHKEREKLTFVLSW